MFCRAPGTVRVSQFLAKMKPEPKTPRRHEYHGLFFRLVHVPIPFRADESVIIECPLHPLVDEDQVAKVSIRFASSVWQLLDHSIHPLQEQVAGQNLFMNICSFCGVKHCTDPDEEASQIFGYVSLF